MAAAYITPENLVKYLYRRAETLGGDAFPHFGRAHYYSGPNEAILAELKKSYGKAFLRNHARALAWAKTHNATVIDNTLLAGFLENFQGVGTFGYYSEFKDQIAPWKELSRLFALSMWGQVSTTVCGAKFDAVYGEVEVPNTLNPNHSDIVPPTSFDKAFYEGLLDSKKFSDLRKIFNPDDRPVEHINIHPFEEFQKLYNPHDVLPAHRRACQSEMRMALHEALEGARKNTIKKALRVAARDVCARPVEAFEYYLDSRERFMLDRDNLMPGAKPSRASFYQQTPAQRAEQKQEHLKSFGMMVWGLIETELHMTPKSNRPNIVVPKVLMGSVVKL